MFKLVSEYKPTGDQSQAIEKLVEGIKKGEKSQVLLGVTGSAKNLHNVECNRAGTKTYSNFGTQ